MVLKTNAFEAYTMDNNRINRISEPIFKIPSSKFGRAHFLSSVKVIGNYRIDTVAFNTIVIWAMTLIIYIIIVLYFHYKMK
jgi:hypothetical protein